jgi:hypothetical protein
MTFQPGNQLAKANGVLKKPRIVTQRLIAELNATDETNIPKLHRLANALLDKALEGDVAAIKEVMDRVEGKVPQPMSGDPDNPLVIQHVTRTIVHADPNQRSNPIAIADAGNSRAA